MTTRAHGADADTLPDLSKLRGRSRDLVRNAPIAAGALKTKVTSIVGWGLDPQPRIDRRYVGLSDQEALEWQRQMKRLWWHWAWSVGADWASRWTFPTLVSLSVQGRLSSGDILAIRQWRNPRAGELFGTRIQLVEADRLCNPDGRPDNPELTAGIELDASGAPLAYWIADRHPDEGWLSGRPTAWTRVPAYGRESGERRVLHLYRPDRPHATRGIPDFAAIIAPLRQLKNYTEAELMAAVVSSLFTVFIKHAQEEAPGGLMSEAKGTPPSTQPAERAMGEFQLGTGAMLDLDAGESIEIANPMRPNAGFDPFVTSILQQVGAAIEIPYEVLVKRFTASYSASMAALQEAWRGFRTERTYTIDHFCQPIYEMIVAEAVLRGYLDAPGFFEDPLARQAWCGAQWTGPTRGHLNPAQESTAMRTRIDIGVSTLEQETAEYSGRDWEENLEQQRLEQRLRREAGLGVQTVAKRSRSEPVEPEPADREPDNEREEALV